MGKFEISGLDKFQKQLKQLEKNVKSLDGEHSFEEIFTPGFMRKNTKYSTVQAFLDDCGYPAKTREDFKAIPDAAFDNYVRKVTRFSSWEDMLGTATDEFALKKLGL